MFYLIDGHNLIPKLCMHLDSCDDEMVLVTRLQEFCRASRSHVDVYFDQASPGQAASHKSGAVNAHFVHKDSCADAAIEERLERLGKAARNWIVVSSDHRVQKAAKAAHAQVVSSEGFSRQMEIALTMHPATPITDHDLSPEEVEAWLTLFEEKRK